MLKYNEWEALNESIGTGYALGVTPTQSLGLTGHRLSEWPVFMDDDDEDWIRATRWTGWRSP